MKKLIQFIIFIVIASTLNIQEGLAKEKIKIGLVVPLSGKYKEIGISILKATSLAINKIDDAKIEIFPRDSKSNPETTLKVSKELYDKGIRIVIGPVFNKNLIYLNELSEITFLSLSNTNINNPMNVINGGINATSQMSAIKKFQESNGLERTILLIPNSDFKNEIEDAVIKTKIELKDKFIYDLDPTLLTAQIEKLKL